MPLTHSITTRLGETLNFVRTSGELWWLRPHWRARVTIEYEDDDGPVTPKKIDTIVIVTQHAEPGARRGAEVMCNTGRDITAPSWEDMKKLIEEKVIHRTLGEFYFKNGMTALTLYGEHTRVNIISQTVIY